MPASCWQHLERAKHSALTPRSANLPRFALSRAASGCFTISTTFGHCSNHMGIQRRAARCSTNSDESSASSNTGKATQDSEHATSTVRQLVQQTYRAHTQGKTARDTRKGFLRTPDLSYGHLAMSTKPAATTGYKSRPLLCNENNILAGIWASRISMQRNA